MECSANLKKTAAKFRKTAADFANSAVLFKDSAADSAGFPPAWGQNNANPCGRAAFAPAKTVTDNSVGRFYK